MLTVAARGPLGGPRAFCSGADVSRSAALNRFLAGVEKRAFFMANAAVSNDADALDIVQDAMMTLATKYAHKAEGEWKPLFYRILRNRITDFHRRNSVRRRLFGWLPFHNDEAPELDPVAAAPGPETVEPVRRKVLDDATARLLELVEALPPRQQEAFLLRALEGLSVAETAQAMKCSEGSVKTHYSRAVHGLRAELEEHWS